MSRHKQLLQRILGGRSDAGIRFDDLRGLLRNLGFIERIRGSHHIFRREGVPRELICSATMAMRSPIRYSKFG